MSNPPTWGELGSRALRVAKVKARGIGTAATGARNTVQSSPQLATVAKTAGTVGKVAKFGLPVVGGLIDAGIGLAEGEDPIRAVAGAAGSTAGGAAGAWAGAGTGAAIGAPLAPFTFGASSVLGAAVGGVVGAVGGSMLGGWGADRVNQMIRGQQPIDVKRQQQAANQAAPTAPGSAATPSYKPIDGAFKPDPNATYSYQPMKPDGSGGYVTKSSGLPAPVAGVGPQQRGQVQPVSFNQPSQSPEAGWNVLPGYGKGEKRDVFTESAAPGARQSPSPNQDGQLVQAGFNPLPAIKAVIPGMGRAAPAAAAAAPAAAGAKLPFNVFVEGAKELTKQAVFLPLLGAAGLLYGAPKAAVRAAGAINAPGAMGPNSLPSQAAWWDKAFFGGKVNDALGNPGGVNYQKNQNQNATQNRGLDIKDRNENRKIDAGVYNTDTTATTARRGQDLRIAGIDVTTSRHLEGVKDTNRTRKDVATMQYGPGGQGDRTNATNLQREVVKGTFGNQRETIKGTFGNQRETIKGTFGNQRETIKGQFGNQREGIKGEYKIADTQESNKGKLAVAQVGYLGKVDSATINADGKVRTAGVTGEYKVAQEGVKQSGSANVANIKAGATMGAAATAAGGKVNVAEIGLQGTRYKADATARVATIKAASVTDAAQTKAEAEGSKAAGVLVASLSKDTANSMAAEDKARIARYRSLGVY